LDPHLCHRKYECSKCPQQNDKQQPAQKIHGKIFKPQSLLPSSALHSQSCHLCPALPQNSGRMQGDASTQDQHSPRTVMENCSSDQRIPFTFSEGLPQSSLKAADKVARVVLVIGTKHDRFVD
jgi:hypothetical protein